MPKFLENKLKKKYPNNPGAVYGTMNKIGAMKGNKITAKGHSMEMKHESSLKGLGGESSKPHKIKKNQKHSDFARAMNEKSKKRLKI